jgi:ribonuclease HII
MARSARSTGAATPAGASRQASPATRRRTGSARLPKAPKVPNLSVERELWEAGDEFVVGVDEVGRGAWAGPVSVGVVVLPRDRRVNGVRDSKELTHAEREKLHGRILGWAVAAAVGHASPQECDELGMTAALRLAGHRALDQLPTAPDRVLLDGNHDYLGLGRRVRTIIGGDRRSLSIAAASIVAKVTRDRLMAEEAEHFPAYGFESNRGYPAPVHQCALAAHGPTTIHRRSWVFMDGLPWQGRLTHFSEQGRLPGFG